LHGCCSDPKFMEEIKHLKIETVTHIFPKFMRMQGDVFDSYMHSFFARTDVGAGGATDSLVQSVRWVEPVCRGSRPRLPLTIGSPELPLYLPYIYIPRSIIPATWFNPARPTRLSGAPPAPRLLAQKKEESNTI
jgi:hypothetical protein